MRRESIDFSRSRRSLLKPGEEAAGIPLDRLGLRLSFASSVAEFIGMLRRSDNTVALRNIRSIRMSPATGRVDPVPLQTICALLMQKCPNLEQLDAGNVGLGVGAAKLLAQLPKLAVLNINKSACDGRHREPLAEGVLEELAHCPALHTLELGSVDLPAGGVSPLARLPTLRSLSLSNCTFYAHDVASIAELHHLTAFYHRGDEACGPIIDAVARLLGLETLFLRKPVPDGKLLDIAPLRSLGHLRRLSVDEAKLTLASLRALGKGCTVLYELCLKAPNFPAHATVGLRNFTGLGRLRIDGGGSGAGTLPASALVALKKHRLTDVSVSADMVSTPARREILRAFGIGAVTYPPYCGSRQISDDHRWLRKRGILRDAKGTSAT